MTALPFSIAHASYAFRDGKRNVILACFRRVKIMAKKKMSLSRKKNCEGQKE